MAYATVMVHVDFDAATQARVRLAADLADRFEATLVGIAARTPHPPSVRGGLAIPPLLTQESLDELKVALDRHEHRFRSLAAKEGRRLEWRSALDFPTEFVVREARAADLVIIGRGRLLDDPYQSLDPGALLLRVGRPVLVVPNGLDRLHANRVAVAWKDTRKARRVLFDSLPFLRGAEKVFVVEVYEGHDAGAAQLRVTDVANYLSRHRITATAALAVQAGNVTDELLRAIRTEQIDLLVVGAYGHSRLGEWVFGGVTRDLLARSPICCFFSH